jgi:glucose-1-phosphate thymidylyltransferase
MEPTNVFEHLLNAAKPDDQLILGLFKVSSPEKFGMVDFGVEGSVMQIIDKPKQTLLEFAWGCIVWRPEFTEHLHHCVSELNISDFAYVMNLAIKKGMSLRGIKLPEGRYADLGTYEEIVALDKRYRA